MSLAAAAVCRARRTIQDLATAITSGDAGVDLRYRYEFVDQDSFTEDASASTLRLRLNYKTGAWYHWSGFVEFDHVAEVLVDDFNSGMGTSGLNRARYPVVADPDGSDLNQLYLQYAPSDEWQARIGRQRILLDDQRFVGGVGWRQNEQTYDSLSVTYEGVESSQLFYAYVANVNRIFGSEVPAGDHDQDTHLLNANFKLNADWSVVGYAYLIDNDDAASFSTDTLGARLQGKFALGDGQAAVLADVARQSDAAQCACEFRCGLYPFAGDLGQGCALAGHRL